MNYLGLSGYWFYGGNNATETASFYSSWGLIDSAPESSGPSFAIIFDLVNWLLGRPYAMFRKVSL